MLFSSPSLSSGFQALCVNMENCKFAPDLVMEMNLVGEKTFCVHNSLEYIVHLVGFSLQRKLDMLIYILVSVCISTFIRVKY